jgi:hypothetical protein
VPSRLNPLIVHVIWGLVGFTLGASLALLVIKDWSPDWIEATGTWFGAVATVLTLLWAVRSFRSDQAEREISRRTEREKELAEQVERERDQTKAASSVSIALKGGGGYGTSPDQMMTSVHVVIQNHAKYDAVVRSVTLDEALTPLEPLPAGVRVPAGETTSQLVKIKDVPGHEDELSGLPMSRFTARMSYRLDGRDWRRGSAGNPERS